MIMVVSVAAGLRYTPAFSADPAGQFVILGGKDRHLLDTAEAAEAVCQAHADRAAAVEAYREAVEARKAAEAALEAADIAEDEAQKALYAAGGSILDII
jgi:hypothetical protein